MRFGATGPNNSSVTACAAGAHSIGEAFHTIVRGAADVMIAGGTEAVITPLAVSTFGNMRALSSHATAPQEASRLDRERDGFVMAEGPVRSSWKNCNMPVVGAHLWRNYRLRERWRCVPSHCAMPGRCWGSALYGQCLA